jgi:hypothetical protein
MARESSVCGGRTFYPHGDEQTVSVLLTNSRVTSNLSSLTAILVLTATSNQVIHVTVLDLRIVSRMLKVLCGAQKWRSTPHLNVSLNGMPDFALNPRIYVTNT